MSGPAGSKVSRVASGESAVVPVTWLVPARSVKVAPVLIGLVKSIVTEVPGSTPVSPPAGDRPATPTVAALGAKETSAK